MPNPELFGGMENEEKENQENNLVIKEATLELLKEINQNVEMKRRAEIYANRR